MRRPHVPRIELQHVLRLISIYKLLYAQDKDFYMKLSLLLLATASAAPANLAEGSFAINLDTRDTTSGTVYGGGDLPSSFTKPEGLTWPSLSDLPPGSSMSGSHSQSGSTGGGSSSWDSVNGQTSSSSSHSSSSSSGGTSNNGFTESSSNIPNQA